MGTSGVSILLFSFKTSVMMFGKTKGKDAFRRSEKNLGANCFF